jgi:Family of unknown function (DUF6194)
VNEDSIFQYITSTFEGVDPSTGLGDFFFIYDPDRDLPPNRQLPFATLVTGDNYDHVSNLSRPSVYRLNIGISKKSYLSLFGSIAPRPGPDGIIDSGHDYTALDQLMPHPVYGRMNWVCILNPSDATFRSVVQPLLAEAYEIAVRNHTNWVSRERVASSD